MIEALKELLEHEPFQPFRIVLTSGTSYRVTNPHLVAWGQTQLTVYQPKSDKFAMLRLNQIAALEAEDHAAA
jgi:hypothetical protein